MDYAALVELIGFDIIFLGLLTLLTCYIARRLWSVSRSSKCLGAFREGWEQYCDYLEGCVQQYKGGEGSGKAEQTEEGKPDETEASGKRPARAAQLIGMLLMASVLGMVINIIGDRLLDSDLFVRNIPSVWLEYKDGKAEFSWWPRKTWNPEDAIKYDALKAVSDLYTDANNCSFRRAHKIENTKKINCGDDSGVSYGDRENHAKELFQRAYAWTMSSDNKPIQAVLRYEYLAIKVLRTLFAASIILLLAMILGPWRRGSWWRLWTHKNNPFNPTPQERNRTLLAAVLLFALPLLFLALWSTQSKRYDKKVFHAYILMAKDNDNDVLKLSPVATPTLPTQKGN